MPGATDDPLCSDQTAPGHKALRRGRKSLPGWTYLLTLCTAEREELLTRAGVPEILLVSLRWMDGQDDTDIDAYVIMPDHLHILVKIRGDTGLKGLVASFKKFTARRINEHLERSGPVWQRAYHDRAVRCYDEYEEHLRYISENPVRAGLAERVGQHKWCSVNGLGTAD